MTQQTTITREDYLPICYDLLQKLSWEDEDVKKRFVKYTGNYTEEPIRIFPFKTFSDVFTLNVDQSDPEKYSCFYAKEFLARAEKAIQLPFVGVIAGVPDTQSYHPDIVAVIDKIPNQHSLHRIEQHMKAAFKMYLAKSIFSYHVDIPQQTMKDNAADGAQDVNAIISCTSLSALDTHRRILSDYAKNHEHDISDLTTMMDNLKKYHDIISNRNFEQIYTRLCEGIDAYSKILANTSSETLECALSTAFLMPGPLRGDSVAAGYYPTGSVISKAILRMLLDL